LNGPVFVDTSAWYAAADIDDTSHLLSARRLVRLREARRPLVTTNHVVGESYTLLLKRLGARSAREYLRKVRRDQAVRRVFVSQDWEEEAERLLEQYADQPFSYVDATSFVTMRRLKIPAALAFDKDFVVAGFMVIGDE
jgi:predicted nucleic acid-binding protein